VVRYAGVTLPDWPIIQQRLQSLGEQVQIRMIDNLPAFPDEIPETGWKELRLGFTAGMVTLRRAADADHCIVWGNADSALQRAWQQLVYACAISGDGLIAHEPKPMTANEFGRSIGIEPPAN